MTTADRLGAKWFRRVPQSTIFLLEKYYDEGDRATVY